MDATQKLKALASMGDVKGDLGDLTIRVSADKDAKTLTVTDRGIGMTADEVERYINQIAFSSAEEFMEKYKNQAIIGHFGLGFYSAFMVADKVEIFTRSYKEGAKTVHWSCEGSPEYEMEETTEQRDRGTTIVLHLSADTLEYGEDSKVEELLRKYCRFLPVPIAFGKVKEWKDGKYVDTNKDNIINNIAPLWTVKPTEITAEQYKEFYHELYPIGEEPLFSIHLNIDYTFHLTGILYFPKIRNNFEIQKNKIQLYSNQVYVTDQVEGIVPEYLTLLHGVIDSPDIPLNVSRSYPQGGRSLAGALHDDACGLRTEMGRSEDLHRIRHYHRRKVRREGREFHAVEDDRRQVFHRRRVQGGRQRQSDRQKRYGRFPLCGRSRREKFVPRIGQGQRL